MNFDCVGKDSKGQMYMKFHIPFNIVEKIQLLQHSILVDSFAYYKLNENIISNSQYDANIIQLEELSKAHSEEFKRSKYFKYFRIFYESGENTRFYITPLELMKRTDNKLYMRIRRDALLALNIRKNNIINAAC